MRWERLERSEKAMAMGWPHRYRGGLIMLAADALERQRVVRTKSIWVVDGGAPMYTCWDLGTKPQMFEPRNVWALQHSVESAWVRLAMKTDREFGPDRLVDVFEGCTQSDEVVDGVWKAGAAAVVDAITGAVWADQLDPVTADWLSRPWSVSTAEASATGITTGPSGRAS